MKNKKSFLVGKKIGMSQIIDDKGQVTPVTVVEAFENEIVRFRTIEKDGYNSVGLGFSKLKDNKVTKPVAGQFKNGTSYKHIKEFRVESTEGYELNSKIDPSTFEVNLPYNLQSHTIGRGFTGSIKAWGHQRGPMTHGSKSHRLIGSIGQATTPGNVKKGKKMHTRYGNELVTIKNLILVRVENNHLFFKGAIPGKNNVVFISAG